MDIQVTEKVSLDLDRIPKHIAVIMDGNGRWAKKRNQPRVFGHKQGVVALKRTLIACKDVGIKYLSVYAFSTENWSRPEKEVGFLMTLFKSMLKKEVNDLDSNGVKIKFCGDLQGLDKGLRDQIDKAEEKTKNNSVLQLNVMLNYGARNEILRACKSVVKDVQSGDISDVSEIDDKLFSGYLDTADCPEPELLIRTSNESRISNFLLWQLSYSELFFIDCLWPDFDKDQLLTVLNAYQNRDRRFGGVNA
ncbi:isoprenyl transferase [bacterium]|jgi:undecaprenyl diphosphate synthase|nr:isoprenyl transferase [bacterium]